MAQPDPASCAQTDAVLPAILDLAAAQHLQAMLTDLIAQGATTEIDASLVARASTPCLQVLLAAQREATARGQSLRLTSPSPALAAAAADLGLTQHIGF